MRRVGLKALEKLNKVNMRIKDTTNGGKSPGRKGFYSSKRDQIVLSDKEDPEMLQYIADHEMTHGLNAGALLNFYRKPNGGHYDNRINEDLARMFSIRKNLPGKYKDTSDKDNYIHPVFFYNTKEKRFMNAGNGMLRASRAGRTKRRRPGAINKNYVQAVKNQQERLNYRLKTDPEFASDMEKAYNTDGSKFQFGQLAGHGVKSRKRFDNVIGFER